MKMIKMTLDQGANLSTLLVPFSPGACPYKKCLIPKQLMLNCARKLIYLHLTFFRHLQEIISAKLESLASKICFAQKAQRNKMINWLNSAKRLHQMNKFPFKT